jgi:hypothetical protein
MGGFRNPFRDLVGILLACVVALRFTRAMPWTRGEDMAPELAP